MPLTRSRARFKAATDAEETEAVGGAKVTSKDAATKVNLKDASPKSTASTSTSADVDTPCDEAVDDTCHLTTTNEPRVTYVDLADLVERCMHQLNGFNPKVLEMLIEFGDIAIDILIQHGKAKSVEEIMQTVGVTKEHQEAYANGDEHVEHDTIIQRCKLPENKQIKSKLRKSTQFLE